MNVKDIEGKLKELFAEHRIVFWNDSEAEFEDILGELKLDDIKVIRPDKIGLFNTKVLIELEHPTEKILAYSPSVEPKSEDDWLLDIRLQRGQIFP
jgi:hypothetical protein